jgi:hypothetical protein
MQVNNAKIEHLLLLVALKINFGIHSSPHKINEE